MEDKRMNSTSLVLNLMGDTVTDRDKEEWINAFHKESIWDVSDHIWRVHTGKALKTVKFMMRNGATSEEIWKGIQFLWICINAKKHNLDIDAAKADFNIVHLMKKYGHIVRKEESDEELEEESEEEPEEE